MGPTFFLPLRKGDPFCPSFLIQGRNQRQLTKNKTDFRLPTKTLNQRKMRNFKLELTEELNGTTSDDKFILNVLNKNDEQLTKLMDKTVNFKRLQLLADFHRKLKSRRNKSDVILYAIEKVENCPVYTKVRKTTKVETFVNDF